MPNSVEGGFAFEGKTFDSLSKIAFAITGTNWNGPRFFGLPHDQHLKEQPSLFLVLLIVTTMQYLSGDCQPGRRNGAYLQANSQAI
jgi:hypothetical protein